VSEGCITADLLATKGAYCVQLDEFQKRFPNGLDVDTVRPKEIAGLYVEWAVNVLLPAPALKVFEEAMAPAQKAYEEAKATAREVFGEAEATDSAWKAFLEAEARAAIAVFREYWQEEEE